MVLYSKLVVLTYSMYLYLVCKYLVYLYVDVRVILKLPHKGRVCLYLRQLRLAYLIPVLVRGMWLII